MTRRLRTVAVLLFKGRWAGTCSVAVLALRSCSQRCDAAHQSPHRCPAISEGRRECPGPAGPARGVLAGSCRAHRGRAPCSQSPARPCSSALPWRRHLGPNVRQGHPLQQQLGRQAAGDASALRSRLSTSRRTTSSSHWDTGHRGRSHITSQCPTTFAMRQSHTEGHS